MFFKNAEIDNFLSLGEGNKIHFNTDMITFIKGTNLDTNGSNGAGKSTIIEAIVWCLFGKTIRGVSADDIVNNKVKRNTRVSLEIDDYTITRYRKHKEHKNTLVINKKGEEVTLGTVRESTKAIEDIFNITYDTFINSVVLGSNVNVNFLSAGSNNDRRKIFENLLDINNFSEFQKECKEREAQSTLEITELETKHYSNQEFLAKLHIRKQENDTNKLLWEENQKEALFKLEIELGSLEDINIEIYKKDLALLDELTNKKELIASNISPIMGAIKSCDKQITYLVEKVDELDTISKYDFVEFKKAYKSIAELLDSKEKFNGAKIKIGAEINSAEQEIKKLGSECEDVTKFIGEPCPTCGTLLDQENLKGLSVSFHDKIVAKENLISELEKKLDLVKTKISEIDSKIIEMTPEITEVKIEVYEDKLKDLPRMEDDLTHLNSDKQTNLNELKSLKEDLDSIVDKISKIKIEKTKSEIEEIENKILTIKNTIKLKKEETNPYSDIKVDSEIKEYEEKLKDLTTKINTEKEEKEYFTFWKEAFGNKGLKIHIFDSVIPFFNNRIQFYLDILSSGKFKLVFDKDLSYEIEGTKYNNNSSGEKKRIDLAVMIALFDMLNLRSSSSSNVLILDEVLDSLDEIGVESVQDLLLELNKRIKNIFIISHNNNLGENFSNILNVVKEDGISTIVR